jgi:hypothetical protein
MTPEDTLSDTYQQAVRPRSLRTLRVRMLDLGGGFLLGLQVTVQGRAAIGDGREVAGPDENCGYKVSYRVIRRDWVYGVRVRLS